MPTKIQQFFALATTDEKCHGKLGARLANDGFIGLVVDLY